MIRIAYAPGAHDPFHVSMDAMEKLTEVRRQVEAWCQFLVDAGTARWWINDNGDTELHMDSGEAYRFGDLGVTRLK